MQNHVGMSDSLIDSDGFPRADIDVYQIRHARHKMICVYPNLLPLIVKLDDNNIEYLLKHA